jgi:hypothetical protein
LVSAVLDAKEQYRNMPKEKFNGKDIKEERGR